MSTVAPARHSAPAPPPDGGAHRPPRGPGRLAQWRATWAVALRMARRDVRRHRGRSALVVVMVLLPTLLLSAIVTVAYTSQVTGPERIPAAMGSGQALLEGPDPMRIGQLADPSTGTAGFDQDALPVPGLAPRASAFANADAIARLVGADVAPLDRFLARTTVDGRRVSLDGLAIDGARVGDKVRLESGRWPAPPPAVTGTPVEALVTQAATSRGVPASGRLVVTVDGQERILEVVGVASVRESWSRPGIVTAAPLGAGGPGNGGWIVLGERPVTWPEVLELNEYGLRVTSAAVLRSPPAPEEIPGQLGLGAQSEGQRMALTVGLGAAMLLISTALLVGPAFAVSATRQRRTLALAASNGAHTPALRRTVLAQALVLGAASAVTGVAAGVGAAYVVVLWDATRAYPSLTGPFDVRPLTLLAIALCATASTVVAALVPARRLGRLDIVGVMRGQSVSPRPSRLVLLAGAVLTALGTGMVLAGTGTIDAAGVPAQAMATINAGPDILVVLGAIVLVTGSLLLVPTVLAGIGRVGGRLPTPLRMAARDLARHRSRSAPSVAAVLAAVAGLTFGLLGLASDTEQNRRDHLPLTLPGEVVVTPWQDDLTAEQIRAAAPGLVVTPNDSLAGDPSRYAADPPAGPYRAELLAVVPDGCELEQAIASGYADEATDRCAVAGTDSQGSGTVLLLPADELVRRLELSGAQAARVRAGAAVLLGGTGPTARVVAGTRAVDPTADRPTDPAVEILRDEAVPAVRLPLTKESSARILGASLAFAAGAPAVDGLATRTHSWTVRGPDGSAVPDDAVERLQEVLGDEVGVQREDGFQRSDRVVVAILLGVFAVLILVVTLTSTALTLAEQQTDQATLAALGATRGTRRVMAAAQAFLLAVVGCLLGVGVGLVPGIGIAGLLTGDSWDPLTNTPIEGRTILVIPWAWLAVAGVGVPIVAAALAAAGIRRAPQVTRRAT